jgi:hypothetical protein
LYNIYFIIIIIISDQYGLVSTIIFQPIICLTIIYLIVNFQIDIILFQ